MSDAEISSTKCRGLQAIERFVGARIDRVVCVGRTHPPHWFIEVGARRYRIGAAAALRSQRAWGYALSDALGRELPRVPAEQWVRIIKDVTGNAVQEPRRRRRAPSSPRHGQ